MLGDGIIEELTNPWSSLQTEDKSIKLCNDFKKQKQFPTWMKSTAWHGLFPPWNNRLLAGLLDAHN